AECYRELSKIQDLPRRFRPVFWVRPSLVSLLPAKLIALLDARPRVRMGMVVVRRPALELRSPHRCRPEASSKCRLAAMQNQDHFAQNRALLSIFFHHRRLRGKNSLRFPVSVPEHTSGSCKLPLRQPDYDIILVKF